MDKTSGNWFIFEDLDVYKLSVQLSSDVYTFTNKWPREYLFDLTSQLRRAALSIALNIAEGNARSQKDKRRFLDISRGSCHECIALINIAELQGLITPNDKEVLYERFIRIAKMLMGLKKSIKI